jgi:hypothetical protein
MATAWKCAKISQNFGDKRTGYCITAMCHLTLPFAPGNVDQKNMTRSHPPYFSLMFPQLKIKVEGCHFDTTEVMEAESQVVLNTLTEHDFRMHLENDRSSGSGAYA